MAPPKHHKEELPSPPLPFFPAISKIVVAQICLTIGYHAAEPSALRSLSDIATLYLQSLSRSASSIAYSRGRTQSNLLDLIRAIEDLSSPRGFAGASDPTKSLLRSSVLKDLIAFVRSVDEIPFPRPIRRRVESRPRVSASFAEVGRDPPFPHVPRWLPCFPEKWKSVVREEGRDRGEGRRRWEEEMVLAAERKSFELELGKSRDSMPSSAQRGRDPPFRRVPGWLPCFPERWELPAERKRVRFQLGLGKKRELFLGDGDDEESGGKKRELGI